MVHVTLTKEILLDFVSYSDGKLFCRKSRRGPVFVGKEIGTVANGYRRARVFGHLDYVHRFIWLYHYGSFPSGQIDHINHDRLDNRIENLRDVTAGQNMRNIGIVPRNSTGAKGVYWHKKAKCFTASYKSVAGRQVHVGCFPTLEFAAIARQQAIRSAYPGEIYP